MLFNSLSFFVFFLVVLAVYWPLSLRAQNLFLLVASYFFYGSWDYRFLSLIVLSTVVDYFAGLRISEARHRKIESDTNRAKKWLFLSIFVNLGLLAIFKYFNFFIGSFESLLATFGLNPEFFHLNVVLPVGISFYTFQTMSYTIDIYYGKLTPTRNFLDFALYVSFFPQLVAGPIERAKALLPQVLKSRTFDSKQFFDGLHLIFWGLFKKVYVADNLATIVDPVFSLDDPSSVQVLIAVYAFAFQIYCDFSGYTDVARGCCKCLGFELRLNFKFPYISKDPSEFWNRWHISLSSWLRDYLYIPLGGNRGGISSTLRNLMLTMLLGGLWHGAAWTFVLWGAFHGLILIAYRVIPGATDKDSRSHLSLSAIIRIFVMFHLVCLSWLMFRAQDLSQFWEMLSSLTMLTASIDDSLILSFTKYVIPLFLIEAAQLYFNRDDLHNHSAIPLSIKTVSYSVLFYLLIFCGGSAQSFIYFQF